MALIPQRTTMPRGVVGTWANMEEDNARTMFAGAEFAAGVPVMLDSDEMTAVPLEDGGRFIGVSLRTVNMDGTPESDDADTYTVNSLFGVADMGTVFVLAGESVTEGAVPFYDTATRKWHGVSDTGRLIMTGCEFDEAATDGNPVGLRVRIVPGAAVIADV